MAERFKDEVWKKKREQQRLEDWSRRKELMQRKKDAEQPGLQQHRGMRSVPVTVHSASQWLYEAEKLQYLFRGEVKDKDEKDERRKEKNEKGREKRKKEYEWDEEGEEESEEEPEYFKYINDDDNQIIDGESDDEQEENMGRVKIAILDSGILPTHPQLDSVRQYKDFVGPKNFKKVDNTAHGSTGVDLIREISPDADLFIARVFEKEYASANTMDLIAEVRPAVPNFNNFAFLGEDVPVQSHPTDKIKNGTSYATFIGAAIAALILDFARQDEAQEELSKRDLRKLRRVPGMSAVFKEMAKGGNVDGYDCVIPTKLLGRWASSSREKIREKLWSKLAVILEDVGGAF
ncbi:hypothetical protein ABW20_dc0102209 [Dactylellina cionopaga]|nr:hypothetical protein ABW20_dc0102209 [Dactylellina cionopaga]